MDQDAVKDRSRESSGRTFTEPQVPRQLTRKRCPESPQEPGRVPPTIEEEHGRDDAELLAEGRLPVDEGAREFEVPVHGFSRHEKVHNLARALDAEIDARVAHHPFD